VETEYFIHGLNTDEDCRLASQAILSAPGVRNAAIHQEAGTATVTGDVDPQAVCLLLTQAGYPAVVKSI
jgi:copper chaperone